MLSQFARCVQSLFHIIRASSPLMRPKFATVNARASSAKARNQLRSTRLSGWMLAFLVTMQVSADSLPAQENDSANDGQASRAVRTESPTTGPTERVQPVVPLDPEDYPAPNRLPVGRGPQETLQLSRPNELSESAQENGAPIRIASSENGVQFGGPTDTTDRPIIEVTPEPEVAENEPAPIRNLTEAQQRLAQSISETLVFYQNRPESVSQRSPWGIMHAMIGFEVDSVVLVDGEIVNALGWLCWNGACAGQKLMEVRRGQLAMRVGPGAQGHEGQFLAMLAQCGVRADNELRARGQVFSVEDLIEYEKRTCRAGEELTFKLIGLSYYLDTDAEWTTPDGQQWSIPRLIQEELKQSVIGAACGGTHRMMGFSFAVQQRKLEGKPLEGQWGRAERFVNDFVDYTFQLQNPNGSFSTNWFEGREFRNDIDRQLQTSGHILEWLVYTLPDDQLFDERVVKAATFVNHLLAEGRNRRWSVGPKGHALRALLLYQRRTLAPQDQDVSTADAG